MARASMSVDVYVHDATRLAHLERWKAEALPLLATIDRCHDLLPEDARAPLGTSKVDAVERYLSRQRQGSEG